MAQTSGIKNAKRANSLVDYLEDKSIEFTETQPRRFLGKNLARGRSGHQFTDDLSTVDSEGDQKWSTGILHEGDQPIDLSRTGRSSHPKRTAIGLVLSTDRGRSAKNSAGRFSKAR